MVTFEAGWRAMLSAACRVVVGVVPPVGVAAAKKLSSQWSRWS